MKTAILFISCAFGVAWSFASTDSEKAAKKNAVRDRAMHITGGFVERPAIGKISVVDMQMRIPAEQTKKCIDAFAWMLRVRFEYTTSQTTALDICSAKPPEGAQFAIFLIDDDRFPMSLIALESGWCAVNTRMLVSARRFDTEFHRVAAVALAGGMGIFKQTIMQSVRSPTDLDALEGEALSIETMNAIVRNLANAGVSPKRTASYRTACKEGWAPAPTNEVQRVIFERIKADKERGPSSPILIKPIPKKRQS